MKKELTNEDLKEILGEKKYQEMEKMSVLNDMIEEKNFNNIRDEKFSFSLGPDVGKVENLNQQIISDLILENLENHSDISNLHFMTNGIINIDGKEVLWRLEHNKTIDMLKEILNDKEKPLIILTTLDKVRK